MAAGLVWTRHRLLARAGRESLRLRHVPASGYSVGRRWVLIRRRVLAAVHGAGVVFGRRRDDGVGAHGAGVAAARPGAHGIELSLVDGSSP